MLQVGCSPGFNFYLPETNPKFDSSSRTVTSNGPGFNGQADSSPVTPPCTTSSVPDKHNVLVHWTQAGHSFTSGSRSGEDDDTSDSDYRPFTPPPPRERLSYTRYQLELLNGIYRHVKYPNSTQKLLVAKRVGITRDQVKIWFQNRRRKDVLAKQARKENEESSDALQRNSPGTVSSENSDVGETMVPSLVMESVINELIKFKNDHLKSKKQKGKKKSMATTKPKPADDEGCTDGQTCSNVTRLFSGYDMLSPPNQITPTAFTVRSKRIHHGFCQTKQSAFERPKDKSKQGPYTSHSLFNINATHPDYTNPAANCSQNTQPSCHHTSQRISSGHSMESNDNMRYTRAQNDVNYVTSQSHSGSSTVCRVSRNSSQVTQHPASLSSPGGHLETIPVLTDLLGQTGRQYSCGVTETDALWCNFTQSHLSRDRDEQDTRQFKYRDDDHGLASYQNAPVLPQIPLDSFSPNRPYPYPFTAEPSAGLSSVRPTEPFRRHPQYPHALGHHDMYQPLSVSSLTNPFYSHHQSTSHVQSWHDPSYQEQHFLQL